MTDLKPTDRSPEVPAELPDGVALEDAERITELAEEGWQAGYRRWATAGGSTLPAPHAGEGAQKRL
jgi:hypothetical protein